MTNETFDVLYTLSLTYDPSQGQNPAEFVLTNSAGYTEEQKENLRRMACERLFEGAHTRVEKSDKLSEFAEVIFNEWPIREEHLVWVCSARESEILGWAVFQYPSEY